MTENNRGASPSEAATNEQKWIQEAAAAIVDYDCSREVLDDAPEFDRDVRIARLAGIIRGFAPSEGTMTNETMGVLFDYWLEWKAEIIEVMNSYGSTTQTKVELSRLMEKMTPARTSSSGQGSTPDKL